MKQLLLIFGLSFFALTACVDRPLADLTVNLVGTYEGTVTLNLDTDSITDVSDQRLEITRVDDQTVQIKMLEYPDSSPVDTLVLTASLTQTPDGTVKTRGLSLTIGLVDFAQGTVEGVPYLTASTGQALSDDGKFVNDTGELLFTLGIRKNGVDQYELFQGIKQ